MLIPGINFKNSPTLPSATWPNSSAETTLTMLDAKRCSLIAIAAPSISFEAPTLNSESFTMPVSLSLTEVFWTAARSKSRCTVAPAVTSTGSLCTSRPVKNTRTLTGPAGTPENRYCPDESVNVSSCVPSIVSRAFSRYSPLRVLMTRPSMVPFAADWADAGDTVSHAIKTNRLTRSAASEEYFIVGKVWETAEGVVGSRVGRTLQFQTRKIIGARTNHKKSGFVVAESPPACSLFCSTL